MIMSPTAPGIDDEWNFTGASTSWEAVAKDTDDTSYISTTTVGQKSNFFCGDGQAPIIGRIMAVTLHYRVRQTSAGVGSVDFTISQGVTPRLAGNVPLSGTTWTEGEIRVREDWTTTTRFTGTDVTDLGVGVEAMGIPPVADIQVSKLWLAIEYIDFLMFYDPYSGLTPDAVTGPRGMGTIGAEPASITGSNYLQVLNTTPADFRMYYYFDLSTKAMRQDYITETEIRCTLSNPETLANELMMVYPGAVESTGSIRFQSVRILGVEYLGLIEYPFADPFDPSEYIALEPFSALGRDLHLRLKIDRDSNPSTYGKVEVFEDYSEEPIISKWFEQFATTPKTWLTIGAFGPAIYGASQNETTMELDYSGWKHYKKRGETFRSWTGWAFGNNRVHANGGDPEIVKPITITPPGVVAGQSQYACELRVEDLDLPCSITNNSVTPDVAPISYKVDVIYKMDIAATEGELTVQRLSDLYYWDETGSSWIPTLTTVTMPNQLTRTTLAAMTGINVTSPDDRFLVSVHRKTAIGPSYKIFVYKVHLVEE